MVLAAADKGLSVGKNTCGCRVDEAAASMVTDMWSVNGHRFGPAMQVDTRSGGIHHQ